MRYDVTFTNGVIKSRERFLLGDKLNRMADSDLDEAFRLLKESGFGGETPVESPYEAEALMRAEEQDVNDFIRRYAPKDYIKYFLLAEYDFHNAEAYVKCRYAGANEEKLVSSIGAFDLKMLKKAVFSDDTSALPEELALAVTQSAQLFNEGSANGLEVDCVFKRQLFAYMKKYAKDKDLKKILAAAADAANVSSALRSRDKALAEKMFVTGGKQQTQQQAQGAHGCFFHRTTPDNQSRNRK